MQLIKFLFFLFLLTSQCFGATSSVVFDSTDAGSASGGSLTTITVSHTCTSQPNSYLGVFVTWFPSQSAITSVKYNNVTMTNEITQADGASSRSVGYWDLVNPSSGTNNIVLTFTTAGSGIGQLAGISFYNVNQTTPLFATNKSSGTSNNPNVSITSAPWNFVVSSVGANGASFVDTQDGTWNLFAPQSAGVTVNYVGYKSGSSISITRSDSLTLSKAWAAIIASIQPAVSFPKTFNNVQANNMSVN